jgi:hypothetical protein
MLKMKVILKAIIKHQLKTSPNKHQSPYQFQALRKVSLSPPITLWTSKSLKLLLQFRKFNKVFLLISHRQPLLSQRSGLTLGLLSQEG